MDTIESTSTGNVKLPKYRKIKVQAGIDETTGKSKLRTRFNQLGIVQEGRLGDQCDWSVGFVVESYFADGYDAGRGPALIAESTLSPEELDAADPQTIPFTGAPLGGNRRTTAAAIAVEERPDAMTGFGKLVLEFHVYPALNAAQRQELINREARTTVPFDKWAYYKHSMLGWTAFPDEEEVDHLRRMGVGRALDLWPGCVKEHALVKTPTGITLKPGITSSKVWEKGKGGNRTDTVQTGKALMRAHPEVRALFFAGRTDPKHAITYRKVIELNSAWKDDCEIHSELSVPPAPLAEVAEKFPDSKLVSAIGEIIKNWGEAETSADGGRVEIGRMNKKEAEAFIQSINFSKAGVAVIKTEERFPGRRGEDNRRDLELVLKNQEVLSNPDAPLTEEKRVALAKAIQEALRRMDDRESAANAANRAAMAAKTGDTK